MSEQKRRSRSGGTLARRVAAGSLLATLIVALLVGLLINSIINLRNADRVGVHSQTVLLRVSRTLSEVLDLETGLRGYVITQKIGFLAPYTQAAAHVDDNSAALVALLAKFPAELRRAQELHAEIDSYLTEYSRPVINLVARRPSAARAVTLTSEGKRRVDDMRARIAAIQAVESARQRQRQQSCQSTASRAVKEGLVVLVVLLALIVLLGYALQRLVVEPARAVARGHRYATLLANASAALDVSLELSSTLPRFCKLLESELADWCVIALLDEQRPLQLDTAAGDRVNLPPDALELCNRGEAVREDRRLVAPVSSRGRALGLLVMGAGGPGQPYGEDDLQCASELARRVGLAVDAARLYEQSAATARVLQDSLLPERLPTVPGLEIASRFRPAGRGTRVGGDFYDVFSTGQGTWAILVGDVCGKGAAAAAVTAMVRYTLRAHGPRALRPAEALQQLNQAMLHQAHDGRFVTIAYATLDLRSARPELCVACGGHPPPLLAHASGAAEPLATKGTLIGVFEEIEIKEVTRELEEGDAIVLYSDGVTEARRGEPFSAHELAGALEGAVTAEELAEALDRMATETTAPRADDVAILAVRFVQRSDSLSIALPADAAAPAAARRALHSLDLSAERLQLATLLTSELVTRAVLHDGEPGRRIQVRASVSDGRLRLSVSDSGGEFPPPAERGELDSQEYGLQLVEELADSWGIEQGAGRAVWFELS